MLFADLEMTANAAVLNQLGNVQVLIAGNLVPGIFRNPSAVTNLGAGAADAAPTVTVASSAVPAAPVGTVIAIAGVAYEIFAQAPDGTGLTVLTVGISQ